MTKLALLRYDEECGKWKAEYRGKMLCQSQNKFRVIQLIETGECRKAVELGVTGITEEEPHVNMGSPSPPITVVAPRKAKQNALAMPKPYFNVNERFEFLESLTDMVIENTIPSLLVTGGAGLGKTTSVMERLHAAGLTNAADYLGEDGKGDIRELGDYLVIKGYSTARGMYDTLYWNRKKLVIFDDCDKVLDDTTAVNILKGALDSTDKRIITWNAKMRDDDPVPGMFEFKGGVIFISNKTQNEIDDAIRSRCMNVDLAMTVDEKLERIEFKMPNMLTDMDPVAKREAFEFLKEKANMCSDLNFRTFLKVAKIRRSGQPNWKKLAEYSITA